MVRGKAMDEHDRLATILAWWRQIDEGNPCSLRLKKIHAPSSRIGNLPMAGEASMPARAGRHTVERIERQPL
jgi:hypothetical protein